MSDRMRMDLEQVAQHFAQLEDPRSDVNLRHPLKSVIVIALMAVLAGAGGPTAIAKWAACKENVLRKKSCRCRTACPAKMSFAACSRC